MQLYVVKDLRDGTEKIVSLEEAAQITKLNEAEIEWALEEFGICETNEHMIHEDLGRELSIAEPNTD
jgi:hypothetical protein